MIKTPRPGQASLFCIPPLPRMFTRKSITIALCATISLLLLLATSRRLGGWAAIDEPLYQSDGYGHHRPPPPGHHSPGPRPHPSTNPDCAGYPIPDNILVIMKTGASESFNRVPTQLLTVLRCVPDFLIFSDMEQKIGGYQVYDSLSNVSAEAMEGNSDFDLYRRQKACPVDVEGCNKQGNPASEGWNLDKYKNVHMAEQTYKLRPDYDWYVFVDADTYVLWPNLVQWLGKLNPNKKHYLGSVTLIQDFSFGHGGSGYIVSKASMKALVGENPGVGQKYDLRAKRECCGDYVFALALKDNADVSVEQMWPTINGEKPATLPFGPWHWCHPIVTMHHMNSEEINTFWEFERRFRREQLASGNPRPLLIKDIYHEYLEPKLKREQLDWDNKSDDRFYVDLAAKTWDEGTLHRMKKPEEYNELEKVAHRSASDCEAACKSLGPDDCVQYKYENGKCAMHKSFILGKPVPKKEGEKQTISGWDVEKIKEWTEKEKVCNKIQWPKLAS
ncbi:hypothetical protein QBC45DRAFT_447771 [Copromyces sp. CBS 386.78]|nr:hypothetical protein QBC45DRAFT_447771 [Copromyces sp. CBS 386.78]